MGWRWEEAGWVLAGMAIAVGVAGASLQFEGVRYRARAVLWAPQEPGGEVQLWERREGRRLETRAHMAAFKEMAESVQVWKEAARQVGETGEALHRVAEVKAVPDSELLEVVVEAETPRGARKRVQALAHAIVEAHVRRCEARARQGLRFIESQLMLAEASWKAARRAVAAFRRKYRLISEEGQAPYLLGRLSALETQLSDARADCDRLKRQCQVSEKLLIQEVEFRIATTMASENPALVPLKSDLASLEAQLAADRSHRTEKHPDVIALSTKVDSLQQRLQEEAARTARTETTAPNPVREELAIRYALLRADQEGAAARCRRLQKELEPLYQELAALPGAIQRARQLEMEAKAAEDTCRLLRAKRDEAWLRAVEAALRPQIQVVSRPEKAEPVDRRPGVRLALAAILSLSVGWGLVYLRHNRVNFGF